MKMSLGLAVLTLSLSSIASTEMRNFVYDGSQSSVEFSMRTEKTHTEYKTEQVPSTCYSREVSGYTTTCMSNNYRPYPNGYPGNFPGGMYDPRTRYPQPGPGRYFPGNSTCVQQPIYREVPYSCLKAERTSYQVKDYDVEAKVILNVAKNSSLAANEKFTVVLNGDSVNVTVNGSKQYLAVLKRPVVTANMNGSVKLMDAVLTVELIEAAPVLNSLKSHDISIENGVLSLGLGPVTSGENIKINLNVTKKKIGSDKVLFDRELNASEVLLKASRSGTDAEVNVNKLGIALDGGKYALTARASFKANGTLINRVQFGDEALSTSRTLIYKIR